MSLHLHEKLDNLHAIAKQELEENRWIVQIVYIEDDPTGKSLPFSEVLQTLQAPIDIDRIILKDCLKTLLSDTLNNSDSSNKKKSKKRKS